MMYNISITIKLRDSDNSDALLAAISPENQTMTDGKVVSELVDNDVLTIIEGKMSIGKAMHTLDDVINTAILVQKIADNN